MKLNRHLKINGKTFLCLILILSFALRIHGVTTGLPNLYHTDENHIFDIAMHVGKNAIDEGNLKPESILYNRTALDYPSFHIYSLSFLFGIEHLFKLWDATPEEINTATLEPNEITLLYTTGRILSVVMGVATVYLTYLIGKRLFSENTGLLSALFLSVAMLHVKDSHFFTLDVPLTFWITLTFFFVTYILEKKELKYYLLAGVSAGLATSTKYVGFLLFPIILVAHLLRTTNLKIKNIFNRKIISDIFDKKIIFAFLTIIFIFIITTPYAILAFNDFKYWMSYLRETNYVQYGFGGFWPNKENALLYHIKTSLFYGMGLPLELLSLAGIIFMIYRGIKGNKGDLLILSLILVYCFFFGSWTTKFMRYAIPLIPFLTISASSLSIAILTKTKLMYFVIIAIVLYSLIYTISYVNIMTQEDVRTTAAKWIDDNIEKSSTITMLKSWGHWTNPFLNKTKYKIYEPAPLEEFKSHVFVHDSDYLVVSNLNYEYFMRNKEVYAENSKFFDDLIEGKYGYKLIKKFEKRPNLMGYEFDGALPPRCILEIMPTILIFQNNTINS